MFVYRAVSDVFPLSFFVFLHHSHCCTVRVTGPSQPQLPLQVAGIAPSLDRPSSPANAASRRLFPPLMKTAYLFQHSDIFLITARQLLTDACHGLVDAVLVVVTFLLLSPSLYSIPPSFSTFLLNLIRGRCFVFFEFAFLLACCRKGTDIVGKIAAGEGVDCYSFLLKVIISYVFYVFVCFCFLSL